MSVKVLRNENAKTAKGQDYTKVVVSSHKPVTHINKPAPEKQAK